MHRPAAQPAVWRGWNGRHSVACCDLHCWQQVDAAVRCGQASRLCAGCMGALAVGSVGRLPAACGLHTCLRTCFPFREAAGPVPFHPPKLPLCSCRTSGACSQRISSSTTQSYSSPPPLPPCPPVMQLQDDRRGLVPASSLLLVDFELQEREEVS